MEVPGLVGPATDAVQQSGSLRQRFVVGEDDAPLARGQRLALLEREGAKGADGADSPASPSASLSMSGVLDQEEPVLAGKRQEAVEVDREAAVVNADDGTGAGRDRGGDGLRIDRQCFGVNIGEDWDSADFGDGRGAGDEGEGRDDDLIANADVKRAKDELERDRAIGDGDAMAGVLIGGIGVLEPFGPRVGMEPAPPPAPQHLEHLCLRLRVHWTGPRSDQGLQFGRDGRTAG